MQYTTKFIDARRDRLPARRPGLELPWEAEVRAILAEKERLS